MSEEKDFVLATFWDGEPVEILENRGDVIRGANKLLIHTSNIWVVENK